MADNHGPWGARRKPRNRDRRFYVFVGLIALGALGVWELWRLFPGALSDVGDQGYFMRSCVLLAVVASGIAYSRMGAREAVRNVAIWAGIAGILILGYTYHQQIEDAAAGARSELVPGYASEVDANTIAFTQDEDGGFSVHGTVNGTTVAFMVDTGASDIVLSPGDARRIGIDMSALHFNRVYETANGEGRGAPYVVNSLRIGPAEYFNVPVSINGAEMRSSLLGMAYLKRVKSFEMKGRKLILRWR